MNNVLEILLASTNQHGLILIFAVITIFYLVSKRRRPIYLLDFVCYRPPDAYRLPMSLFIEHVTLDESFDHESVNFQLKILEKSGFGSETCIPPSMSRLPLTKSSTFDEEEAKTIIFSIIKELFEKNSVNPKTIDILIINSSMFSPTPSLSAMVVNKFGLRSNIMSYNLSGMGCSAGLISVDLAKDLLRVHRNSLALIVSTEILTLNWYNGKKRSMLLTNCLFRMGGVTLLMSSRDRDKKGAKYVLQHLIRTHKAREDRSYNCVFQDLDSEDKVGVSLSKDILHIAGDALKANIASLGPLVLPFTEQLRYGISIICRKTHVWGRKTSIYIPNFQRAFEHFCIHAGGRAVIHAIETNLRLSKEDVEASKMTLYRFGNTSSSSVWYELCYIEAKQRVKRGDRVWQIAFGSGFKCNSAVWKRVSDIDPKIENAWTDRIHSYPVDVPNVVKLTD